MVRENVKKIYGNKKFDYRGTLKGKTLSWLFARRINDLVTFGKVRYARL